MPRTAKETPWYARRKGSPTFYAFWYDQTTRQVRRITLGTADPAEAKARFALFLSEGDALTRPAPGGLTVSQALNSYWTDHCIPNCADQVRQHHCLKHLRNHFGNAILSEVDIPASRLYAEARRESGAADSTIRRELSTLVAAANHARRWKRITEMPSIELTAARLRTQDDEAPFFSKAQIADLIDAADGEFRCFLQLLYYTGARRRSISELEWDQVKWDQKLIILQKPGRRVTKKRRPIVPILPEMAVPLALLHSVGRNGKVFELSDQRYYYRFKDLCERLGFPGHPHMFRHSRATHLLQDGVSLYAVARLLGDTVGTVEKVYGHHSAEFLSQQLGNNQQQISSVGVQI